MLWHRSCCILTFDVPDLQHQRARRLTADGEGACHRICAASAGGWRLSLLSGHRLSNGVLRRLAPNHLFTQRPEGRGLAKGGPGRAHGLLLFRRERADIRKEIERHGSSAAGQRVRGHVAAGRCACDIRNPRGMCCLGDVNAAVTRVESSLQSTCLTEYAQHREDVPHRGDC